MVCDVINIFIISDRCCCYLNCTILSIMLTSPLTFAFSDVLSGSPYVLTPTIKKSFEMVLMALSQKWPVLLHGPAGSGKTALINKLAQLSGSRGTLHLSLNIFFYT